LGDELAGVGRERLDEAALAFGVDGVKSEGGLARARDAGEDSEAAARQAGVKVFQIVLASAVDFYKARA